MSETGRKLIQAVRDVAKERPFHIHRGHCVYVTNGEPGCLIGQALWNMGLIDASIERHDYNDEDIQFLLGPLDLDIDDKEADWLAFAQGAQDERRTWAAAVREADCEIPLD